MRYLSGLIVACVTSALLMGSGESQTVVPAAQPPVARTGGPWPVPNRDQVNAGTVTIVTAPIGGMAPTLGANLASVLDDTDRLRVLPILSKGFVQNVLDVLFLKSVDLGMIVSDVPEFYKLQYNMPNIESRLRYIAKLYNAEIHIVAPTSIKTIYDLAGKRVMAPKDVGYFAAKSILTRLNIDAHVDYEVDPLLALQKVIDGEADAWFVSAGKVQTLTRSIKNAEGKLHLVSIPFGVQLLDLYLPAKFTNEDYPNLVAADETVATVAASVLLVTFNWPENSERYNRVARFVDAFFSKIDEFNKPPWDPKWKESSITASVSGWTRFKAAQDWLDRHQIKAAAPNATSDDFRLFLARRSPPGRRKLSQDEIVRLYNEFVQWSRR
jgi:TRAP-type uncharacterized transport system substrate-binding protein